MSLPSSWAPSEWAQLLQLGLFSLDPGMADDSALGLERNPPGPWQWGWQVGARRALEKKGLQGWGCAQHVCPQGNRAERST